MANKQHIRVADVDGKKACACGWIEGQPVGPGLSTEAERELLAAVEETDRQYRVFTPNSYHGIHTSIIRLREAVARYRAAKGIP
jgi:hypothetical protein